MPPAIDHDGLAPPPGFVHVGAALDGRAQRDLLAAVGAVVAAAPFFVPRMPRTGRPFSVRMTNCGTLGWVSDEAGYRYQPRHPVTGDPWPPLPGCLLEAWKSYVPDAPEPEACLINLYQANARMGLHQDRDEADLRTPVLSISLGDTAVFRIGGVARGGKTVSLRLASGDVVVLGGRARLAHHGIDRIVPDTSTLLPGGGRINLTLRRVTPAP